MIIIRNINMITIDIITFVYNIWEYNKILIAILYD